MTTHYMHNLARYAKPIVAELTNDQITRFAPATAATAPAEKASARYSFVSTLEVIDVIRASGWYPYLAQQAGTRKKDSNHQKHLIRFRHRSNMLQSSAEFMEILLYNSHDTGSAFHIMAGVFRAVCANGMVVGDKQMEFRHKHVGFDFDKISESTQQLTKSADLIAPRIETMKQIPLIPQEKEALAKATLIATQPEDTTITPEMLLRPRRNEDKSDDLWTSFNMIQENIIKGGFYTQSPKTKKYRKQRAVKAIDKNLKLNKAMWALTERMAELKLQQ